MITPKKIAIWGLGLAVLIVCELISYVLPKLPNGLGSWFILFYLVIIIYSFTLGIYNTVFLGIVYYGVLAWTAPAIFISGITYVKTWQYIFGIYFLDYIIPFLALAFSSLLFRFRQYFYLALLNTILMILLSYFSHVMSGILFWSAYAWIGWSAITYSIASNAISSGILLFSAIFVVKPTIKRLKNVVNQTTKEDYAKY